MKTIAASILLAFFANGQQLPVEPAAPAIPATPAQPAAAVPMAPLVPVDPGSFTCNGLECYGRTLNVAASQGWKFDCKGNCAGLIINLEAGYDQNPGHPGEIVTFIDSIGCYGPNSCAGMTINVANSFCDPLSPTIITRQVEINDLRCEAIGACDGMTINAQCGVDIMKTNFDCQQPGTCVGCIVRNAFELKSCDQNQNPNGAMTMPWEVQGLGIPHPGYIPSSQMPFLPGYTFVTQAGVPTNGLAGPVPQQVVPQQAPLPVKAQPAQQPQAVYYPYPQYQGQQPVYAHYY